MKFNYQARTKTGEIKTGIIEASSKEAALDLLQKYQLFITLLEEAGSQPFYTRKIKLFSGISPKDLVMFSRQLSLMFKSRIPLVQALQAIADQTRNQGLKEKTLAISEDVEGGTPFSQTLAKHPKLFSSFYISMVKSGEASGTLSKSLDYLADHLEKEYQLSSKLKSAMIYPMLIVAVVIGVLVMMIFFVIPNLAAVLKESGQELPFLTKAVIALSDFARSWGWIAIAAIFAGILFGGRYYFQTTEGRSFRDRALLRIPAVKSFLQMIYITRFAENLSTLISGGLPIVQALEITGEIVGNSVYKTIILEIREEVKKGESISGILQKYPDRFPPLLSQMVAVGEKTGGLDQTLLDVVDFYRKETERSLETLLALLEPVMIVILGLLVAGLMASVLMPLYKMTTV
jgi:type IV pilus assembly protein PilC